MYKFLYKKKSLNKTVYIPVCSVLTNVGSECKKKYQNQVSNLNKKHADGNIFLHSTMQMSPTTHFFLQILIKQTIGPMALPCSPVAQTYWEILL